MRSFLVLVFTLGASPAFAGALGEVVGGLQRAAGNDKDDDKKEGSSSSSSDDDSSSRHSHDSDSSYGYGSGSFSAASSVYVGLDGSQPPPSGVHAYLYLAGQSVVDSDGSLTMEMRGWYEDFGLGVRQTSFFEKGGPEYLRLDLWSVAGHYRVLAGDDNELWIEAGLGGFRTIDDLTMWGGQGGVRLEHAFNGTLGITAEGRMYLLENNVRASEWRAAFHVSILQLAYRIVDFNVGPPLHGPEVGIGFTF
jgi:hypothetical protein